MKRNQWRKASKRVFGGTDDRLGKAYRLLFGPENPAGCVICGEDEPGLLGIHKADDSNDFRVLCGKCYDAPRQSFDNNLQKQIGGVNV